MHTIHAPPTNGNHFPHQDASSSPRTASPPQGPSRLLPLNTSSDPYTLSNRASSSSASASDTQLGEQDEGDEDEDDDEDIQESQERNRAYDPLTTTESALVQPAPFPLPEPYIVNRPTTHNTPAFSFGSKLDLISPKILHDTLMSPVPPGYKFMCRIVRKNEGMDKRIYPTYELSLEEPIRQRRVFLLRATKKKRSRGSYYAITSDMENFSDHVLKASDTNYGVLGKLRSNFLGTAFNVYSNGRNPFSGAEGDEADSQMDPPTQSSSTPPPPAQENRRHSHIPLLDGTKKKQKAEKNKHLPVRQELGAVIYNPNVLGLKGPRKMTILMNTMTADGSLVECRPTQVKDTLINRMTDGDMSDLLVLRNKSPQWNDETNSFVLNFGGRVSLASVKNFQIVHDNDLDYIIMQFGRTSQDNFTMDCQYPMTPFQAFAFALTSFDAKLACE